MLVCVQAPHNQLTYSIIGDANALQYLTISSGGLITLIRSPTNIPQLNSFTVRQHCHAQFQLVYEAYSL